MRQASVESDHTAVSFPPFPLDLVLTPVSRWPTTLPDDTVRHVLQSPLTVGRFTPGPGFAPRISILVVTLDGLVFTRLCLESLLAGSAAAEFEIIVVDNGSTDGTRPYLAELSERDHRVRVELNDRNIGFGAATNRAAAFARGDVLVMLNNDTIAPLPTLRLMADRLHDPCIGLLGAVTNRAGNEAEIAVSYRTLGELTRWVEDYRHGRERELFDIRTATLFCAAVRRSVWEEVGALDEQFEIGLFEDDDYAMRIRQAGYRVACAEDLFVHHFGQASIGRLGPTKEYGSLFAKNRSRWEAKWHLEWQPYERRPKPAYQALVERIRASMGGVVPADATVLVISKGDVDLLQLDDRRAWHFPQTEDGTYAGHYPADSAACIAELERLGAKGAEFLLIPSTARWWLDHYTEFRRHLEGRHRMILTSVDCDVFNLRASV